MQHLYGSENRFLRLLIQGNCRSLPPAKISLIQTPPLKPLWLTSPIAKIAFFPLPKNCHLLTKRLWMISVQAGDRAHDRQWFNTIVTIGFQGKQYGYFPKSSI
jgi:hypothetical protein